MILFKYSLRDIISIYSFVVLFPTRVCKNFKFYYFKS